MLRTRPRIASGTRFWMAVLQSAAQTTIAHGLEKDPSNRALLALQQRAR